MHIIEFITRFRAIWERIGPLVGLLFFLFRVLSHFGSKRREATPPTATWTPRRRQYVGGKTTSGGRWSSPSRTRFSTRWSVNDAPR